MSEPITGSGVLAPTPDLPPAPANAITITITDEQVDQFVKDLQGGIPSDLIKLVDGAIMMARPLLVLRGIEIKGGIMQMIDDRIRQIMAERGGKAIAVLYDPATTILQTVQAVANDDATAEGTVFKIAPTVAALPTAHQLLDPTALGDPRMDGDGENDIHETPDQPSLPADAYTSVHSG